MCYMITIGKMGKNIVYTTTSDNHSVALCDSSVYSVKEKNTNDTQKDYTENHGKDTE